ncbi:MAG: menaquinone biosynthesis protein [Pyrinomonadaceae bacterium]|nr:menaquinone biosynthesis protein [Pyrinomonadaceae bacterium]
MNEDSTKKKLRVAASSYSNTAPLVWEFWHGARQNEVDFTTDAAPSRCAEMLRTHQAEIALTPVIEYQRIDGTIIIPNVCVASTRKVRSVVLVTKGEDLRNAKTVALDVSSKTSVALTQTIFREFYGREPEYIPHSPNIEEMLNETDAALLIGDPALNVDANKFRVFDIVETWREFTNHGFVFAFWLANENFTEQARQIDFAKARDEGLTKINEIIEFYKDEVSLSQADFRTYLTENIAYTLDDDLLKGLNLFYELAHKNKVIERRKPLKFSSF